MMLTSLNQKKRLNVLGLNSGTSADGIDLAVVWFDRSGGKLRLKFSGGSTRKYRSSLRQDILHLADSERNSLEEMIRLDNRLGDFMGRTASNYIDRLKQEGVTINLVASHGQTIRHLPRKKRSGRFFGGGTLQVGSPAVLAQHTGRIVVSDFRQADISLGNEGAPITVSAMDRLFHSKEEPRLIVNIGGMSNYFYFPTGLKKRRVAAIDCGPGNSLSDILAEKLFGLKYDRGGRRALRGKISRRLMSLFQLENSSTAKTRSTGREAYGPIFAEKIIELGRSLELGDNDLIASAAELTVRSIVTAIRPVLSRDRKVTKLYLTGGGRKNMFYNRRLQRSLPEVELLHIDQLGVDGDLVEAAAYAVMGEAALRGEALRTDFSARGARAPWPVSGVITQPPAVCK